jgi:hypothetical protein
VSYEVGSGAWRRSSLWQRRSAESLGFNKNTFDAQGLLAHGLLQTIDRCTYIRSR